MQGVEYFRSGETLLAILIRHDASSSEKYNFLTSDEQPFQLGMSFYKGGEVIPGHAHLPRAIRIEKVQELIVFREGRARLRLYDEQRQSVGETLMNGGDIVLLLAGGHAFDILEDTKIVEVKQGPFEGREKDKVIFE